MTTTEGFHFQPFTPPDGTAMHSWRALILQELNKSDTTLNFIPDYRFNLPWNSPTNLAERSKHPFNRNPYQFFAVVSTETAWSPDQGRSIEDVTDGTSNTAFVVGIRTNDVQWNEPVDLFLTNSGQLTLEGRPVDLSNDLFVLQVDGSVAFFEEGLSKDIQKGIFTINGEEQFDF